MNKNGNGANKAPRIATTVDELKRIFRLVAVSAMKTKVGLAKEKKNGVVKTGEITGDGRCVLCGQSTIYSKEEKEYWAAKKKNDAGTIERIDGECRKRFLCRACWTDYMYIGVGGSKGNWAIDVFKTQTGYNSLTFIGEDGQKIPEKTVIAPLFNVLAECFDVMKQIAGKHASLKDMELAVKIADDKRVQKLTGDRPIMLATIKKAIYFGRMDGEKQPAQRPAPKSAPVAKPVRKDSPALEILAKIVEPLPALTEKPEPAKIIKPAALSPEDLEKAMGEMVRKGDARVRISHRRSVAA